MTTSELRKNRKQHGTAFAWGSLQENYTPYLAVTSTEIGEEVSRTNVMTRKENNDEFHQSFEYLIDQTIRRENSEICLTADNTTFVTTRNCSETTSMWAIDSKKKQVIELNHLLCLTAVTAKLILQPCERSIPQQSWRMEFENVNPELRKIFPLLTLEDLKYVRNQMELEEEVITRQDVSEVFHWGNIKRNKFDSRCLTVNTKTSKIELAFCITLESGKKDPNQLFEYAIDYTILKFNTDLYFDTS